MNKKCLSAGIMVMVFAGFVMTQTVYAFDKHSGYKKTQPYCDVSECRFQSTVYNILEKHNELNLSKEQISQIKKLSATIKKDLINRDAKIKTLNVEINTLMWEFPFETEAVNELLSEQYALKTEQSKYLISAYARLEAILAEEQVQKLKELS